MIQTTPNFRIATAADLEELLNGSEPSDQKRAGGGSPLTATKAITNEPGDKGPRPPAARQDTPPVVTQPTKLEPISCDNAFDFHRVFWPEMVLYPWQEKTLLQLSGAPNGVEFEDLLTPTPQEPLLYSLVAANGSGKSAAIIARIALWFCATRTNGICVVTSATFSQLKELTFRAIARAAEDINALLDEEFFVITECRVVCPKTRSFIKGFATDQPGRAEGWHPEHGGELMVLIDEAKTIDDEMFEAFSRFTGFSWWIEVSSPGQMSGHFYRRTTQSDKWAIGDDRQDTLVLGTYYSRRVTAFQNPHISKAHIDGIRLLEGGEHGMLYKSSILAEFTSLDDGAVIKQEICQYAPPAWNTYGLNKKAGLDLSLGGDETVLSVWQGNKRVNQYIWRITDSARLRDVLIETFAAESLKAEDISADGGGLGKVVIQMIREKGWEINAVNNESAAVYKREFLNRGMEMYWKVKRLIEDKILILPHDDRVCMAQLTSRQCQYQNGKLKLQSKSELSQSPDRADAMVLAFATVSLEEMLVCHKMLGDSKTQPKDKDQAVIDARMPTMEQLLAGIDKRRADEVRQDPLRGSTPAGTVRPAGMVEFCRPDVMTRRRAW